MHSDNREGPANRFDDAAREAYTAAMDGVQQKGVQIYERPHLWDEERPCSVMDTPTDNFIPTPTISTGEGFKSLSLAKKSGRNFRTCDYRCNCSCLRSFFRN